jgi:hypothetical protein
MLQIDGESVLDTTHLPDPITGVQVDVGVLPGALPVLFAP